MSTRVAQLHPLDSATTQLHGAGATSTATPTAAFRHGFPMTGRELRAQLRAQQACNSTSAPCNIEPEKGASVAVSEQAPELRALVALILADDTEADRNEALAVALGDPEAALVSFRAMAANLQPGPLPFPDDRRTCQQCGNLMPDGRCQAARRGEIVASGNYEPIRGLPHRCGGHIPGADDADRRPGRERWPGLLEGA